MKIKTWKMGPTENSESNIEVLVANIERISFKSMEGQLMLDHGLAKNDDDFQLGNMPEKQLMALMNEIPTDSYVRTKCVEYDGNLNSKKSICECRATAAVEHVEQTLLSTA